jgi:class 3 adenylate cyclase
MRCANCHHDNPDDFRFCMRCGTKLEHICPACGASLPPESLFCGKCGVRLPSDTTTAGATVSAQGRQARSPRLRRRRGASLTAPLPLVSASTEHQRPPAAYTPPHLREKILTSRSALEGERKQVTILFADLKGSMELLADRDPEDARRLLDPVLTRMMEAVHHYEGTVNQVLGDGIMALFGTPLAHEDHAVRACYAALRMQELVQQYAVEVQRTEGLPIQMRVGLNTGEVVVRSIGSDLHMDYTAVGQTVHLAARMEQMAMPGSILLTAEALRLAEGSVQVEPLGAVRVKGLLEPVEAFELLGAGPVRTRLQAAVARGLTRFVGRQHELDMLRQVLERAQAGHGQVVALVGEPGVGQSRLVYEFTRSHRTQGWMLLESNSVSYGKATAYLPLIDLLKRYFQIETDDPERRIREKIAGKLLLLDETLMPLLPVFLALLDVPVDAPQWHGLDPLQRRQQTLEAAKRLLLRESQLQPLLLLCEDLHWIDAGTQAFLDSLVDSLPSAAVLLLVNYRPEYQHGWGAKTYYTQLRLDPLPPESAEELLQAPVGDDPGVQALKRLLIERTGGNPFFLEENVRTVWEKVLLYCRRAGTKATARSANREAVGTLTHLPDSRERREQAIDLRFDLRIALIPFAEMEQIFASLQDAERLADALGVNIGWDRPSSI